MSSALKARWRSFLEESSFIRHYLWKYRRLVGVGLLSLILVDILEILPPLYLKESVDVVVERKPEIYLAYFALAYFVTALLQGACRYGWRMFLIRSSLLSGRDLRDKYGAHLFGMSAGFYDRRRIGNLMSLATSDVDAVRLAIGHGLLTLADAFFYFLTVPVAMWMLSPQLTMLAFVPLPFIPWFVMRRQKEIHSRFEKVQESFGHLATLAQESLNGVRVTKAFAREDEQIARFRKAGEEYIQLNLRLARVQATFGPTLDFTMSLGLVLLLFVGGRAVITDAVTLGTFVAFQRYIQKMIWPMMAIGMSVTYYQRAVASSGRLKEIFSITSDVPESEKPRLPSPGSPRGRIEFRNLSFRFPGQFPGRFPGHLPARSEGGVLSGINLTVEPGERVAFVGTIGSGKSALLALLPRLYPVERGMLLIDGVDVNDWPLEELRRAIGYVSQEVFLFSETVTENVAFGLHEWAQGGGEPRTVSGGRPRTVEDYTRLAAVHEDAQGLVNGYQTRLGERGVNLSGGQKQRLTLARALAKQPSILVLDDALSSVDVQTEEKILKGIRSRPGRNTELIAAHRISTVKDSDRIVVLDQGKILQQGSHTELIADRGGAYFRFYEQQRLKEDLEQYAAEVVPDATQVPEATL